MIPRIIYIIYLCISILGLLSGCAYKTSNEVMNSWKGAHISSVIRSWGPPNRITSDGAGGHIYIWSEQTVIPNALGTLFDVESPPTTNKHVRMFYVRSNGIIYH